jgi:hypothetical protein
MNQGLVSTAKVLQNSPLPFVKNANDTFTISTTQGVKNLPAVLTPDQASIVANNVANESLIQSGSTQTDTAPKNAAPVADNKKWLLYLAAATVTVIAISASANNDKKLAGLAAQKKISLLKM